MVGGLAGCAEDAPAPEPAASASASVAAPDVDPAVSAVETLVVPVASSRLPKTWREVFLVPYGPGDERLGTSGGGDAGVVRIGPEYGAVAADGSWWFLDVAKQRLAHYDATGRYLDAVAVPRQLIQGRGFAWTLPHILADGSLVAVRLTPDGAALLRLREGRLDELPLSHMFTPSYDDGSLLYGSTPQGSLKVLDPDTGKMWPTTEFLTPGGTPFSVDVDFDRGSVTIEREANSQTLVFRTASGAVAHVGVQWRAGSDDSLHLFLTGTGADDESTPLVGYLPLEADGAVGEVEPFLDPFSSTDPGSPAQLVVAPGSSTPMLVFVRADGVHVYAQR